MEGPSAERRKEAESRRHKKEKVRARRRGKDTAQNKKRDAELKARITRRPGVTPGSRVRGERTKNDIVTGMKLIVRRESEELN